MKLSKITPTRVRGFGHLVFALMLHGQIIKAEPLSRNEVTKKHSKELAVLLGSPIENFATIKDSGIPIRSGNVYKRVYLFKDEESCLISLEADKKGIVIDAYASSETCFGEHTPR